MLDPVNWQMVIHFVEVASGLLGVLWSFLSMDLDLDLILGGDRFGLVLSKRC